ncbi:MAG: signal transduction histidine kinase [Verrucomicrobiales bacterium]|jgi:signal transduction histidine kinase
MDSPPVRQSILIVDDDPDTVSSLSRLLKMQGYETDSSGAIQEALARDDWDRFLAVILDRRLPDGVIDDYLQQFRDRDPDIAIIIATGYSDLDGTIAALRENVEDYLIKPVNPDVLKTRLTRISEHRIARATVQRLEREVLNAAEEEKHRIAMELHDGVGAALGGINMLAKVLQDGLMKKDGAAEDAELAGKIQQLLSDTIRQARMLARGLHPIGPEPGGLMHALKDLTQTLSAGGKADCQFVCRRPVELHDPIVANHLFRISQEAANNAIRHGLAKTVVIRLETTGQHLILEINDDGNGFDPAQLPEDRGIGLHTMEYRARAIHGTLRIESKPGEGTRVICQAPCSDAAI